LYYDLYQHDKDKLSKLIDTLEQIQVASQLDRTDFANVVVSFVQDIPYSYVLDDEKCEQQEVLYENCIENELFGILSPVEFLHTLSGDCDTRTVLLYTLFKNFNYNPKIAISQAYAHSVLLLDIAASGDHIIHKGQKYFFWETTSTGWEAGILPPDANNVNNWSIALH
jgi:hypothetical protein